MDNNANKPEESEKVAPSASEPAAQAEQTRRHSFGGKVWAFVRIMNVRLRFIFLMVIIGVVAGKWEDIMNHYDRWRRPAQAAQQVPAGNVEYFCPMHPDVIRSESGNCPKCGMPLSKRTKTARPELAAGVLGQVQLTPLKMSMGRIGTTPVQYRLLAREARTVGIIDYDETLRATITARFKGRLDKLLVNFTGQRVKQGDPLALIYSPDLLVAQEELLSASEALAEEKSKTPQAGETSRSLVEAAKRKLLLWGLSGQQVADIIKRGQVETHVAITSPISGIVTERKALQGKYVMEGDELYTVADLSNVWLQAKIFESDIQGIRVGTAVEVTTTAYPNEIFAGRITFVAYSVEASTRTVSARVEIANPDEQLKPGMYVSAAIRLPMGKVTELAAATEAAETQPASAPAGHGVAADDLAKAYLALADLYASDKTDPAAVKALAVQVESIVPHLPAAGALLEQVRRLEGKDLRGQRDAFRAVGKAAIELLGQMPPTRQPLYVAHCPMPEVNADWLMTSKDEKDIRNPYQGSAMLTCGSITGPLKTSAMREETRFVEGYYCPIYPDRLFEKAEHCPIDKFPLKRARVEKVLAVPESAIIDTGTRKVAYRQSVPGTFEMVEVQLGPRAGEFYPVVAGLKEDDQVATAGAFLVDAENRLNPAASAQYFGASGGPQSGGASAGDSGHPH